MKTCMNYNVKNLENLSKVKKYQTVYNFID